ncbi:hypothetical protein LAZ67_1007317 [Cordylochernes scorpioides]|uniref:Uncharacterized protein n=1 Tax=Cordylochernes scorpioides TaxID=51811 RepID=A0ABY6JZJ9_9ARAC|nr:hypothetical protein LAZ67_1007317 [Cordylochernes scorpioides]
MKVSRDDEGGCLEPMKEVGGTSEEKVVDNLMFLVAMWPEKRQRCHGKLQRNRRGRLRSCSTTMTATSKRLAAKFNEIRSVRCVTKLGMSVRNIAKNKLKLSSYKTGRVYLLSVMIKVKRLEKARRMSNRLSKVLFTNNARSHRPKTTASCLRRNSTRLPLQGSLGAAIYRTFWAGGSETLVAAGLHRPKRSTDCEECFQATWQQWLFQTNSFSIFA